MPGFLLRIGRLARWTVAAASGARELRDPSKDGDVREAAKDVRTREPNEGISVFRVEEGDVHEACVLFGLTCREAPSDVDWLLVAEDALSAFSVVAAPDPALVPWLAERHCEIRGIDDARSIDLARAVLQSKPTTGRLRQRDLVAAAEALLDDTLAERLPPRWLVALGRLKDDVP